MAHGPESTDPLVRKVMQMREAEDHAHHEQKERDTREGLLAAEADIDKIRKSIDARIEKGFYELPGFFRSNAKGLSHQRILANSNDFLVAYASGIQRRLGPLNEPFFVNGQVGHDGKAVFYVQWKRFKKPGGH